MIYPLILNLVKMNMKDYVNSRKEHYLDQATPVLYAISCYSTIRSQNMMKISFQVSSKPTVQNLLLAL